MKRPTLVSGHVAVVVFTALLGTTCSVWSQEESNLDMHAIKIWRHHDRMVQRAIRGRQTNDDFDEACLFFERVAGIEISVNIFTLGLIPTPETKKDLVRIRAWYKKNKNRLYWDEALGKVALHPEGDESSFLSQSEP